MLMLENAIWYLCIGKWLDKEEILKNQAEKANQSFYKRIIEFFAEEFR